MFGTSKSPLTPAFPDGRIPVQADVFELQYVEHVGWGSFHARLHQVLAVIGIQWNHCRGLQQDGLRLVYQGKTVNRVRGFGRRLLVGHGG